MAPRHKACVTFVGNPERDSRISRMCEALAEQYELHLLILHESALKQYPYGTVHTISRNAHAPLRQELFRFWREGSAKGRTIAADIYLASDLYSLPVAARAARTNGAALIYDSRELYSSIAALEGRAWMQRFWNFIERRYLRRASAILTVNTAIAEILRKRYPTLPVHTIHNFPMPAGNVEAYRHRLREEFGIPNESTVLISNGGLQHGRGLVQMVEIVSRLPHCHLVFLGDGPLKSALEFAAAAAECSARVHFKHVPSNEVIRWTAGANIGLCLVEDAGLSYRLSLPNKLFEYIHAGIPSVCTSLPVIREMVERWDCGILVDEPVVSSACDAITTLTQNSEIYRRLAENSVSAQSQCSWIQERKVLRNVAGSTIE